MNCHPIVSSPTIEITLLSLSVEIVAVAQAAVSGLPGWVEVGEYLGSQLSNPQVPETPTNNMIYQFVSTRSQ